MASVAYSDGAPRWVVTALTVAAAGSGVALKRVKGIGAASSTVGHHGGAISLTDGALVLWRLEAIVGYLLHEALNPAGQQWYDRLDGVLTGRASMKAFQEDIARAVGKDGEKFLTASKVQGCDIVLAAWVASTQARGESLTKWRVRVLGDAALTAAPEPNLGAGRGEPFFLTTAINYTNGNPHVGHAYEAISADVIARYHRRFGRDVFFMTGTDEHGQKIAEKAEAEGVLPIANCDKYAQKFQDLNKLLAISNDYFIRTTMPQHLKSAQALWSKCASVGDIYLGQYEGWYDVKEEAYVTDAEAEAAGFKGPSGNPLEKKNEASYFFKMSKYHDQLVQYIETHADFIRPQERRAEILERLHNDRLRDLSISRATFKWGVPVPSDPDHVMYVWFDALSNYATGSDAVLGGPRAKYWPPQLHLIGKDIIWFHCVIWPCMLMSAEMPLPHGVFAHGFVQDKFGRKMSKSEGNVVDPFEILMKPVLKEPGRGQPEGSGDAVSGYPSDLVRLFSMRRATFGGDLKFSELDLKRMNNKDLADVLGNLAHRSTNLIQKYCEGVIPEACSTDEPFDLAATVEQTERFFAEYRLKEAADLALECTRSLNEYITEKEPWKLHKQLDMKVPQNVHRREAIVRTLAEALYVLAHFIEPFMPTTAAKIFGKLGTEPLYICDLGSTFEHLAPGTAVTHGEILFDKFEITQTELAEDAEAAAEK
eukprot:m.111372 g.111372  ORF g.111372 m.111372 type:complete len:708 (-) comp12929_c0_seq1:689-2812(-)